MEQWMCCGQEFCKMMTGSRNNDGWMNMVSCVSRLDSAVLNMIDSSFGFTGAVRFYRTAFVFSRKTLRECQGSRME